ncbi:MAG TPA: NAD-dependent epimerase/dehydratase family protein [Solirubrobacter sp.]
MLRGSSVLVTGGSGFIGSHVVDQLLAAGHRPRIFDVRPSPYHPDVDAVEGDLDDLDAVCAALHGCDAVIHLAASADVNEVFADPMDAERRNVRGTLHVLEAARRCDVGRVVYASTIWTYSDTAAERHEESMPLSPPAHFYTSTKLAGELYCHSYAELYGLDYTILRFGIPYGPRARPAAVVPAMVGRALAGEPLTVAGDGSQSRRFVYVEDLAAGVVRALDPVAVNRTYNLVGDRDVTIREVAETVCAVVGDAEIAFVPGRTGDFAGAPVCGERAAAELGWRPTTAFEDGVRHYVAWRQEAEAVAATAVAAAVAPAPERVVGALVRRSAWALGWALVTSVLLVGLAVLIPVDSDLNRYGTFFSLLLLLLPLCLAGGFRWEEPTATRLRAGLWGAAVVSLALALAPWPSAVDVGANHATLLVLLAVASAGAERLVESRIALPAWLGASGG